MKNMKNMKRIDVELPKYLQRMIIEDIELETKTKSLKAYIDKNVLETEDPTANNVCMCEEIAQYDAMIQYAEALNERIDTAFVKVCRLELYAHRYDEIVK